MPSTGLGTSNSGSSGGSGAATNSIVISLNGIGGLGPTFYGDSDQTTTLPQRQILQDDTQMVAGFFNPWMRQGYLSPSVSTLGATTFSNAPTYVLSSSEYDALNQTLYFGEAGRSIQECTSIDGTSFSLAQSLDNGCIIDDLQIYELGGVRSIFYSYQLPSTTFTANSGAHTIAANNGHYANGTIVTLSVVGGSLPTGLSAATPYYIVGANGSVTFQLSATLGGSAIAFSSSGSGTMTMTGVSGLGGIGVAQMPWSSAVDGWLNGQTTLSSNVINPLNLSNAAHFMRLGYDGYMYIFDGSVVHRLDGSVLGGASGTITKAVYGVLPYQLMTDAISYRQQMFIAVQDNTLSTSTINATVNNYYSEAYVTVWDMTNQSGDTKDIIRLPGIKTIKKLYIAPAGQLRMICVTANSLTQIREYNGSEFIIIKQLGLGGYPQYPDSLVVADQLTMWVANDGTVYGHGQVLGNGPEVLAKIGSIVAPGSNSSNPELNLSYAGAILYGAGSSFSGTSGYRTDRQGLTIGWSNGTSTLSKFFPFDKGTINSNNQYALAGNIYTGVHFLESSVASYYTGTRFLAQLSTVGFINIFMAASGTDTTDTTVQATVRIFFNGSTTQWGSGKGITKHDISVGYKRIEVNQPYVNTVQLEIEYVTGSVLSDNYDFHPYTAMIYYSPSNTRG